MFIPPIYGKFGGGLLSFTDINCNDSIWVHYHISLTWNFWLFGENSPKNIHHIQHDSSENSEVVIKFTLWWTNIALENHHF